MTDAQEKTRLRKLSDAEVIAYARGTSIGEHPVVQILCERMEVLPARKPCEACNGVGRIKSMCCPECSGSGVDLD